MSLSETKEKYSATSRVLKECEGGQNDNPENDSEENDVSTKVTGSLKSFSYFENGLVSYSNYSIVETLPKLKSGYLITSLNIEKNNDIMMKDFKTLFVYNTYNTNNK